MPVHIELDKYINRDKKWQIYERGNLSPLLIVDYLSIECCRYSIGRLPVLYVNDNYCNY
jgi:hypothetical protein